MFELRLDLILSQSIAHIERTLASAGVTLLADATGILYYLFRKKQLLPSSGDETYSDRS